jgi:hypothetical protein
MWRKISKIRATAGSDIICPEIEFQWRENWVSLKDEWKSISLIALVEMLVDQHEEVLPK